MRLLVFIVIITVFNCRAAASSSVHISVESDIYQYAQNMLTGQTVHSIDNFYHPQCQRDVVEFILVQRAIKLGGLNLEFIFDLGNYDARNLKLLQKGLLLVSFDSIWHSSASLMGEDVFISDPVIRKGEYVVGLYASEQQAKQLRIETLDDFKKLTVASSRDWLIDWLTISHLEPKELIHESDWIAMAKLVSRGWVDVMLAPFRPDYPFVYQGRDYKIVAVDNIKLALEDSRHFVVSRNHPLGKQTYSALQKGLKLLRESGLIERAYRQCGFINAKVDNWPIINAALFMSKKQKNPN